MLGPGSICTRSSDRCKSSHRRSRPPGRAGLTLRRKAAADPPVWPCSSGDAWTPWDRNTVRLGDKQRETQHKWEYGRVIEIINCRERKRDNAHKRIWERDTLRYRRGEIAQGRIMNATERKKSKYASVRDKGRLCSSCQTCSNDVSGIWNDNNGLLHWSRHLEMVTNTNAHIKSLRH